MTLTRLLVAALAVLVWFALWAFLARRITKSTAPLRLRGDALEALLWAMFATLWFGSLGHGAWWVLFLTLGLLIEGPIRRRHRPEESGIATAWRPALLGTLRILGAGGILSLLL